jgi:hypothetical protein
MAKKTIVHQIVLDEDEPFFLLRGNSTLSPQLVQIWAAAAKLIGGAHPEKIADAYKVATAMRAYLKAHDRQEFPILSAIEQSMMVQDVDTPPTGTKETH